MRSLFALAMAQRKTYLYPTTLLFLRNGRGESDRTAMGHGTRVRRDLETTNDFSGREQNIGLPFRRASVPGRSRAPSAPAAPRSHTSPLPSAARHWPTLDGWIGWVVRAGFRPTTLCNGVPLQRDFGTRQRARGMRDGRPRYILLYSGRRLLD